MNPHQSTGVGSMLIANAERFGLAFALVREADSRFWRNVAFGAARLRWTRFSFRRQI
jgi:hypothetical protein